MSKLARPAPGDIVVRQERREQVFVYILHTESGPDQLVLRSREEAVERATLAPQRQQVRAWLTIDGQDHTPTTGLREVNRKCIQVHAAKALRVSALALRGSYAVRASYKNPGRIP